jgi:hypothetical protein
MVDNRAGLGATASSARRAFSMPHDSSLPALRHALSHRSFTPMAATCVHSLHLAISMLLVVTMHAIF